MLPQPTPIAPRTAPTALIKASHPEPAVAVTLVATGLAFVSGRSGGGLLAVAATVLASQLAIGWVNDAIDVHRDAAAGRRDKPVATGAVSRRTVAICGAVAAAATVPLGFLSGVPAGLLATLALGSALLYDWPLKSTVISVAPYAVSFGSLPAFVLVSGGQTPPVWLVAAAGLLGAGAHFANVLPDLAHDELTGVRGLPQRLGRTWSSVAAAALLLGATLTLTFGPAGPPSWAGYAALVAAAVALMIGGYAGSRDPASKAPFRAVMLIAVFDVVLLLVGGTSL